MIKQVKHKRELSIFDKDGGWYYDLKVVTKSFTSYISNNKGYKTREAAMNYANKVARSLVAK